MSRKRDTKYLSEPYDQILLIGAFAIGATGILSLKLLRLPPLYALILSASVLIGYALASYYGKRTKIEPETIGDNCYYLGFLFTLTSLSIVLYQISLSEGEAELFRDLISGFGVALSSTIWGVLLRIVFMQARHDLVARERESRLDLQAATREYRAQLAQSILEVKSFSTEATQIKSEIKVQMTIASESISRAQKENVEALSNRSLDLVEDRMAKILGGVEIQLTKAAERSLENSANALSEVIEQQLTHMRIQTEDFSRSLDANRAIVLKDTEQAKEISRRIRDGFEALQALVGEDGKTPQESIFEFSRSVNEAFDSIRERADTASKALDQLSQAKEQLAEKDISLIQAIIARITPKGGAS